jgi:hypothetical protein
VYDIIILVDARADRSVVMITELGDEDGGDGHVREVL